MKFIDTHKDRWHALGGEDGPPVSINAEPHLLLDTNQWHAARANWPAGVPVGVKLSNDQDVEDVATDLPRFALVALQFPKWTDGRAYSQARLLRQRRQFTGEIRATGDVLIDQLVQMQRSGFTVAVLKEGVDASAAQRQFDRFHGFYQGDAIHPEPHFVADSVAEQAAA